MSVYHAGLGQIPLDPRNKYTGCWTGSEYTDNVNARFTPKPLSEIFKKQPDGRTRVDQLNATLTVKGRVVKQSAEQTKALYKAYINTDCSGYFFNDQECIRENQERISQASVMLTRTGDLKRDMYKTYLEVMSYAPDPASWSKLCANKIEVDVEFEKLTQEMLELGQTAHEKLLETSEASSGWLEVIENVFKAFLLALQKLLEAVINIFSAVLDSVSMLAKFMAKYPKALLIGGGVVAIGVLGFVLRPYFSIASAAIETATGD